MKRKYYPTMEQALTILEEKLNANFIMDSMYSIPFLYPCDEFCHYHLDMMDVVTTSDHNFGSRLEDVRNDWDDQKLEEFHQQFYEHKKRHIGGDYEY